MSATWSPRKATASTSTTSAAGVTPTAHATCWTKSAARSRRCEPPLYYPVKRNGCTMQTDLVQLVERFAGRRILLVGDFMLDRYIFGDAERVSPEAPVPVLRVIER